VTSNRARTQASAGTPTRMERQSLVYTHRMSNSIDSTAFDRVIDPVFRLLSRDQAAQIVDYHADESLQRRIEELAQIANEGELTEAERAEYEGYAHANKFVAVLKTKAKRALDVDR
jgi:hypothetical protein